MTLIFVYNAESGLVNGVIDSFHKVLSPATYPCDLCALTHGLARMRARLRHWLRQSGREVCFFHRSDFRAAWPHVDVTLPAILKQEGNQLTLVLGAADLADVRDIGQLLTLLDSHETGGQIDISPL